MKYLNLKLIYYLFVLFLIVACSKLPLTVPETFSPSPEPSFAIKSTTEPLSTFRFTLTPARPIVTTTSESTPAPSSIFNNPNQVTDGKLALSIEKTDTKCYEAGSLMPIKITYYNLTRSDLTIVDFNAVSTVPLMGSRAQVVPILTTSTNERIRSKVEFMMYDIGNAESPLFQQLPPRSSFEYTVQYRLPNDRAEYDKNNQLRISILSAGNYLLRFVYVAPENESTWFGTISSNQIEICIAE